jgi:hypothetical protein
VASDPEPVFSQISPKTPWGTVQGQSLSGGNRPWPALTLVGVAGFEPTTSSSRTKRATKLRYTPSVPSYRSPPLAGDKFSIPARR